MKTIQLLLSVFILLSMISSVVPVMIYSDTDILADGYTLNTRGAGVDFAYLDIGTNYTNTSYDSITFYNITYASNMTNSHNLIERDGHYSMGNYSTDVSFDVYSPSGWTSDVRIRIYTNNSFLDVNHSMGSSYVQTGLQKHYIYNYIPANTHALSISDMGWFDVDIYMTCYNTTLIYYGHRTFTDVFQVYILDPPYNLSSSYDQPTGTINMTWTNGNHSDSTLIRRINNSINPSTPTQGYTVYNGTDTWFNDTATIGDIKSYSAFSYNATTHSYSEPLYLLWGALQINVFNASKTWQNATPFGLFIQNQAGDITYRDTVCYSPMYLDINDIPTGTNTIFNINSSGYRTTQYTRDTTENNFWNYTFLLPPDITVTPGTPGNTTESYTYLITVVDQASQPISNALVVINVYRNATDTYEQIYSFLTDGAGQVTPWLTPNILYQIIITKDGFDNLTNYWTPSSSVFTKTFQLTYTGVVHPTYYWDEQITFNGYMVNSSARIYVNFTDLLGLTENWQLYIYQIDPNSTTLTLITSWSGTNQSFQLNSIMPSNRHDYKVVLVVNHTYFGYHTSYLILFGYHPGSYIHHGGANINLLFTLVFKYNPFGWANTIGFIIILACFFSFGRRETYMSVFLIGCLLLAFHAWLGFDMIDYSHFSGSDWGVYGIGVAIPILIIFVGILMLIRDRGYFGSS